MVGHPAVVQGFCGIVEEGVVGVDRPIVVDRLEIGRIAFRVKLRPKMLLIANINNIQRIINLALPAKRPSPSRIEPIAMDKLAPITDMHDSRFIVVTMEERVVHVHVHAVVCVVLDLVYGVV